MSPWLKLLLGIVFLALGLLAVLQLKSERPGVATNPRRDVASSPADPARVELRELDDATVMAHSPAAGANQREPVAASAKTEIKGETLWRVSGVVMTPQSEHVPHAEVLLAGHGLLGVADAEGKFELSGETFPFPVAGLAVLTGRVDGFVAPFETLIEIQRGGSCAGLALVVVKTRDVTVRLVDAQQRPVANVRLSVGRRGPRRETMGGQTKLPHRLRGALTDDDGRAVLEGLPRIAWNVVVWSKEYSLLLVPLDELVDELVLNIGWRHVPYQLSGFVRDESGRPIASAELELGHFRDGDSGTSALDGSFAFERHRSGDPTAGAPKNSTLAVSAEGFQPVWLDLTPPTNADPPPLEIVLAPELTIAGVVLDEYGNPVAGSTVAIIEGELARSAIELSAVSSRLYAVTDKDGRFQLGSLWPGVFPLEARSGNEVVHLEVPAGTQDLVLRFTSESERAARFRVRARDAESGAPLVSYKVKVKGDGGGRSTNVGQSTEWTSLPSRKPGSYAVTVSADGYLNWRVPSREYSAGEYDFDLRLERSTSLHLRVTDRRGFPVAGVLIAVTFPGPFDRSQEGPSIPPHRSATGYDGRCIIKQVRVGRVEVHLLNEATGEKRKHSLVTTAGDTTEHVIEW